MSFGRKRWAEKLEMGLIDGVLTSNRRHKGTLKRLLHETTEEAVVRIAICYILGLSFSGNGLDSTKRSFPFFAQRSGNDDLTLLQFSWNYKESQRFSPQQNRTRLCSTGRRPLLCFFRGTIWQKAHAKKRKKTSIDVLIPSKCTGQWDNAPFNTRIRWCKCLENLLHATQSTSLSAQRRGFWSIDWQEWGAI